MAAQIWRIARALHSNADSIISAPPGKHRSQGPNSRNPAISDSSRIRLGTTQLGEDGMTHRIGILLLASTAMIAPAAAQNAPNPAQAAAKALLQAADNAIGASKVKSYVSSSTGWRGYPGQQFAEGDLPRTDVKQTRTVDFASKSAKSEYVRTQGNNVIRGGGALEVNLDVVRPQIDPVVAAGDQWM